MTDRILFDRMLDVIERDIVPLTEAGVRRGDKVFGAAVLRKSDFSLVIAGTNHESECPLWHGEIYAIREFYAMSDRPAPSECLFLSTHEPCSMCISALAWSGFDRICYLFGYESTRDDFNIPHDLQILRDVFGCQAPTRKNRYYEMTWLLDMIPSFDDPGSAWARYEDLRGTYARLSAVYQAGEKKMVRS
jgi:tRNA(Arg) A34 adenosine deaminase TadA